MLLTEPLILFWFGWQDQSAHLQTEEDMIQMKEAASIINSIKNRRESLPGSRKVSLDDVTGGMLHITFHVTSISFQSCSVDTSFHNYEDASFQEGTN